MSSGKAPAIGIDLGTTYSCVAVFQHGKVEIIPNENGERTTPSYVAFTYSETGWLVGNLAKAQAALNPENTVFDTKRLIGRKFEDSKIQCDRKHWPFKVKKGEDGNPKICVSYKGENKQFSPEGISAMILTKMKETAELHLGQIVTDAVITVPAYFNDSQRKATIDAGRMAGLNVLRIINEPTAAALAYGLDNILEGVRNVLIFDLGGGTFDVSVLTINNASFEVKASSGDTHLGGQDFDNRIMKHLIREFKDRYTKNFKIKLKNNPQALWRLRTACEEAKKTLSTKSKACIKVDALYRGIDLQSTITRYRFEELCSDLFDSTLDHVKRALNDANMDKRSIHDVILVGGSTRIPKVQNLLRGYFNDKELYMSINQDEAVAYGAAVHAGILTGSTSNRIKDVVMFDVAPLSLGVELAGGIMSKVIERNSRIPCEVTRMYTTHINNQTIITIRVYEGERGFTRDNRLLGQFILSGIPPAPQGIPQIEETFSLDANGILQVSAKEIQSGRTKRMIISYNLCRLSKAEIDRKLKEAEKYQKIDEKRRKTITARSTLEGYIHSVRQTIKHAPNEKLTESDKEKVKTTCKNVIRWLQKYSLAEKSEIEFQMMEAKAQFLPIMMKLRPNEYRVLLKKSRSAEPTSHEV